MTQVEDTDSDLKKLPIPSRNTIYLSVLVAAVVLGVGSGYLLSGSHQTKTPTSESATTADVKSPQSDTQTFKDFAEGMIAQKPSSSAYDEGTHLLIRDGASPVALTSSVVDLNQYVGKKVKVYGETQKALKQGWLMDVGRVDVEQ